MKRLAPSLTAVVLLLLLAVVARGASGPSAPPAPTTTVAVVEAADACTRPGSPPALAARLRARGIAVRLVCGPADATAAVLRAAVGATTVLGAGAEVRAAMALAAADHPDVRFRVLG